MDEDVKEEVKEETGEGMVPRSRREEYMEYLKARHPGKFDPEDEESVYGFLSETTKGNDDAQDRLAEALSADPRLAQLISDVLNKKRGAAAAFARYFGRDLLNAEEGTPEWDEIQNAESERMAEKESRDKAITDYQSAIDESSPALEKFAADNHLDIDEFLSTVYDRIIDPIFNGKYTPELLTLLNNAINYDVDVEQAMKAGKVEAQNKKIEQMRSDKGDGMPALGGSAGEITPKAKRARTGALGRIDNTSVWDRK
jgi:hypothetical protein